MLPKANSLLIKKCIFAGHPSIFNARMNLWRPFALSNPHFSKEAKPESNLQFLYRSFDRSIARNFPNAYRYYRFAIDGGNSCWFDVKTYFRIKQALRKKERTLADLSIQELLIYIQVSHNLVLSIGICANCHPFIFITIPNHRRGYHSSRTRESLIKLVPLAIIMVTPGVLPFLIYVVPGGIPLIIFLIILFPNFVLTRHFWTDAQTQRYHGRELARNAHILFPKIIDHLKQQSKNPEQFKGLPISINELHQFPLPSLDQISFFHQFYLKRLHKVSIFSIGESPLLLRAQLMQLLDEKMASNKEMIDKMNAAELRLHLYLRKLHFEYILDDDKITASMRSLLNKWLDNTQGLFPSAYIHAPVLIQARPDQFSQRKAAFWEPEEIQKKLEGVGKEASKWTGKLKKK